MYLTQLKKAHLSVQKVRKTRKYLKYMGKEANGITFMPT